MYMNGNEWIGKQVLKNTYVNSSWPPYYYNSIIYILYVLFHCRFNLRDIADDKIVDFSTVYKDKAVLMVFSWEVIELT